MVSLAVVAAAGGGSLFPRPGGGPVLYRQSKSVYVLYLALKSLSRTEPLLRAIVPNSFFSFSRLWGMAGSRRISFFLLSLPFLREIRTRQERTSFFFLFLFFFRLCPRSSNCVRDKKVKQKEKRGLNPSLLFVVIRALSF